jgi:hypothetical protein
MGGPSPGQGRKKVDAEWAVELALVSGAIVAAALAFLWNTPAAISGFACWLAVIFCFVAGWDLLAGLGGVPVLDAFDNVRLPAGLRPWVVPAALLIGLLFGHFYWKQ